MKLVQTFKIAVKSGAAVTLNKITGGGVTGLTELSSHPLYLSMDTVVLNSTAAAFDTTFFGCPGIMRMTLEKLS